VIVSATKGGKITGASDLVLDLATVSIDGRAYQISTADMTRKGSAGIGANKRTGVFTGGGAAVGAIIGAIAGGGKGAAIGAISGGGAGAAAQVITKGAIKVPAETVLTFKLDRPLRVVAVGSRPPSERTGTLQTR
jgi:outer membrane lipoprotein SlyB